MWQLAMVVGMKSPVTSKRVCGAHIAAAVGTAVLLVTGSACAQGGAQGGVQKPISKTPLCATAQCHTGIVQHTFKHTPVANLKCLDCHDYAKPAQHTFTLKMPQDDLCSACHEKPHDNVVHTPVANNNCIGCHDVHGSEFANTLIADPARDLCVLCHQKGFQDGKFVHGPVAVGACIICHDPHAGPKPGMMFKSTTNLCLDCHSELTPPKGIDQRLVHTPAREDCTQCHDPHTSDHQFQLKDKTPDLCAQCHDQFHQWIEGAVTMHGPVGEDGGCVKCHSPHFSKLPKLQKAPQPQLCLTCHNVPITLPNGHTIPDMKTLLEQNPSHHGPIREGACTACHQPHASEHFRLLTQDYPAEFYSPFDMEKYKLCFTCHQSDMVKDESGTGLTGFRNGDLNLHWVHVNREKGRTCRACHEVHASKQPFHIRDSVPFGTSGWKLPINYQKSKAGGSCAPGCHKPRSYSRAAQPQGP